MANKTLAFELSVDFSEEQEPIEELGDSFGRLDDEEAAELSGFLEMELPDLSNFPLSVTRRASFPSVELRLSEARNCRQAGSEVAASALVS